MTTNKRTEVVSECTYHVVFCTKYKKNILNHQVVSRLDEILKLKASDINVNIIELHIHDYYVDALISCSPDEINVHKVVKGLKDFSSSVLRNEFTFIKSSLPSLWTGSYYITTVGEISKKQAEYYISQQKVRGEK